MLTRRNLLHAAPAAAALPLAFRAESSLPSSSSAPLRDPTPGQRQVWYFRLDQDGKARGTVRHEIQPHEMAYVQTWSWDGDGTVSVTTEKTIGAWLTE